MSISVLLVSNEDVPEDVRALLESKISKLSIVSLSSTLLIDSEFNFNEYDLTISNDWSALKHLTLKGATVLHWNKLPDLSSKIDEFLQLRRRLSQYPLNLQDWTLKEVLHNSQDCIIYRGVNADGVSAAIKRFKFKPNELSGELIQEFLQGVEKQCAIRSKGLVHFYDGGICNHAFYLVMEYLKYGTLKQALNGCDKSLPVVHALEWFEEIAFALDCVHKAGLIHRDLKVDNIMLRSDGTLALTDYGVSTRILMDAGFINEDELHCSPYYVSPELITGETCTQASDIYSLGVIFYELLTGHKPYSSNQVHEIMMQHVMAPLPVLPEEVEQFQPILDKMMAKNPGDRFSSALEAIEGIDMIANQSLNTPPHLLEGFQ